MVALKSVISNFDDIIKKQNDNSFKSHDIETLNRINLLCSEEQFRDSINVITVSLFTNKTYLKMYEKWDEFYSLSRNKFIDRELNDLFVILLQHYKNFYYETIKYFHFYNTQDRTYQKFLSLKVSDYQLSEDEVFEFEQSQVFDPHKDPFPGESWPQSDERIHKLQDRMNELGDLTLIAYDAFIAKCNQKLG